MNADWYATGNYFNTPANLMPIK